jgi:hypothetical protein
MAEVKTMDVIANTIEATAKTIEATAKIIDENARIMNITTIVFTNKSYIVDYEMIIDSPLFNSIKNTTFKCDDKHHDVFIAINNDEGIYKLVSGVYASNLTYDERLTTLKQLKQSFDYFDSSDAIDDYLGCIHVCEQDIYFDRVNKYVDTVMTEHKQLRINGVSAMFKEELCEKYRDRIDFSKYMFDEDHHLSEEFIIKYFPKDTVAQLLVNNSYYPIEKLAVFKSSLKTINVILSNTAYITAAHKYFNLSDVVLSNRFITKAYLKSYNNLLQYYNMHLFPNKAASDLILDAAIESKDFSKWSNISVQYLPVEIIKQHANKLNFSRADRNKAITTDLLDELILMPKQISQLATSTKVSAWFIRKHLACGTNSKLKFNPKNKNLSLDFILSIANNINTKSLSMMTIDDMFAIQFCKTCRNKKQASIAFMSNENISYSVAKQLFDKHLGLNWANGKLTFIIKIALITRYEFIRDNMHVMYLFTRIPLQIYEEFKIVSLLERIYERYESPVVKLVQLA